MVHILNTQTPSGLLYEVDMRLRPSGNSGLLVTGFGAFERYQRESAWTWEHQALARARWVAGGQALGERFTKLRHSLLTRERDPQVLRDEVVAMREKMREALGTKVTPGKAADSFHLKHDPGGIIDIEFLVQYLILAGAARCQELTRYSDNIRQLETLEQYGFLDSAVAQRLIEVYIAMRSTIHRRALQKQNSRVAADDFLSERDFIRRQWQQIMLGDERKE